MQPTKIGVDVRLRDSDLHIEIPAKRGDPRGRDGFLTRAHGYIDDWHTGSQFTDNGGKRKKSLILTSMDSNEEPDPLAYLEKLDRYLNGEEQTTLYFELEKMGQAPPFAEDLNDEELSRALTDMIWGLWDLGVVVDDADHLSDRDLYIALLEYCDQPTVVFPEFPDATCHWSPIGGCSDEDMRIWHRYYADEESREDWIQRYPNDEELPPRELPPFYRSWLPNRAGLQD